MRRFLAAAAWATAWAVLVSAQATGLDAWNLNHAEVTGAPTVQDCLGCHDGAPIRMHASHPVDVEYAYAASRQGAELRPPEEALRRGVLLADGKIHCLTCHDPRSPWKSHVALPPGSTARTAVVPGQPATWAPDRPPPTPGAAVSPTPLCLACHSYGD